MNDEEEWWPWIEHDGKGCPCVGMWVQAERVSGAIEECVAGVNCMKRGMDPNAPGSAWVHTRARGYSGNFIIRYRIRKPRALRELREMIENLPVREDA